MLLNNHLKSLDKHIVRTAAIRLMEQNYTTTTLEVKQLLRSQNYWAIQATISRWMDELAEEEDWYFETFNYHRNYFKNEVTANYFTNMTQDEMDYFLGNIKFSVN
ncbi:MAG: hypothetical protein AB8G86_16945 [Saprospiraceae bacterium]